MTALMVLLIALAGVVLTAAMMDLISEEVRGRLDALPFSLLGLAARRLPDDIRAERLIEWEGELYEILRGAEALPVTRLWRGVRYAIGIVRAAPAIVRELSAQDRKAERRKGARERALSGMRITRNVAVGLTAVAFLAVVGVAALGAVMYIADLGYELSAVMFTVATTILFGAIPAYVFTAKKNVARAAARVAAIAVVADSISAFYEAFVNDAGDVLLLVTAYFGSTALGGLSVGWVARKARAAVCSRRLRTRARRDAK